MVREFPFRPRSATSLAAALVVAACSSAPTEPAASSARTIEHPSPAIGDAAAPNERAIVVARDQRVVADVDEIEVAGRFHSKLAIGSGGRARGSAQLAYAVPTTRGNGLAVLDVTFTGADLDIAGGTFVVRFRGDGRLCLGASCRTFPVTGTITPEPADDCLIYEFLGPPARTVVEAHARLILGTR